jgi:hypothetical protein
MNVISPKLDIPIDSTLTVDNTQSNSPTPPLATDFSKLLAQQELPDFMLTPDLPVTLSGDLKSEKDTDSSADSDTQAQLLTYFTYEINPLLGQINHLVKTLQPAHIDEIGENNNANPEMTSTNVKKVELNIQNQSQLPDTTAPASTTMHQATLPVIKNDFEKLLAIQEDDKLSENNDIDISEVGKPKSSIESNLKNIPTDTNLVHCNRCQMHKTINI